jgi:transposase
MRPKRLRSRYYILRWHRLDPVLPLSPGRAERHGFEYYRHGRLSLYAALNVKTGRVAGKTARRHSSAEFIEFLSGLVNKAKWARQIHIVLDNLSAHKTPAVQQFLAEHPKVRFHFTPTYSSWLNQVEVLFAKIEAGRDCTRDLHFSCRSPAQANDIHPRLFQACPADPLDLCRCEKTDCH